MDLFSFHVQTATLHFFFLLLAKFIFGKSLFKFDKQKLLKCQHFGYQ